MSNERATVGINYVGKRKYIGTFDVVEAVHARNVATKMLLGNTAVKSESDINADVQSAKEAAHKAVENMSKSVTSQVKEYLASMEL